MLGGHVHLLSLCGGHAVQNTGFEFHTFIGDVLLVWIRQQIAYNWYLMRTVMNV